MTTASCKELRKIWDAARPVIERQMDDAEIVAAMRKNATDKGFDWSQIKALLKAEIQDERDEKGGERRIRRLLEKADNATAYADMLGIAPGSVNEKNFSDANSAPPPAPAQAGGVEAGESDEQTANPLGPGAPPPSDSPAPDTEMADDYPVCPPLAVAPSDRANQAPLGSVDRAGESRAHNNGQEAQGGTEHHPGVPAPAGSVAPQGPSAAAREEAVSPDENASSPFDPKADMPPFLVAANRQAAK